MHSAERYYELVRIDRAAKDIDQAWQMKERIEDGWDAIHAYMRRNQLAYALLKDGLPGECPEDLIEEVGAIVFAICGPPRTRAVRG